MTIALLPGNNKATKRRQPSSTPGYWIRWTRWQLALVCRSPTPRRLAGTNLEGGFTHVGLHTGGVARDTCWPLVREVLKVTNTFYSPGNTTFGIRRTQVTCSTIS